jgi:photosystem II stability/assembly factor-like uncharacterized protein
MSFQNILYSQEYWINQTSPTDKNLTACFFTDTLNGWITGDSGLILHTSNKGKDWVFQNSGITNEIAALFFWAGDVSVDTGAYKNSIHVREE